eukprot:6188755-Pleurochrysis_carterae.AAC.1
MFRSWGSAPCDRWSRPQRVGKVCVRDCPRTQMQKRLMVASPSSSGTRHAHKVINMTNFLEARVCSASASVDLVPSTKHGGTDLSASILHAVPKANFISGYGRTIF